MTLGKVYLVGAGPGDPGLITVRGLEVLSRADAVLYDALAHPALLDACPHAEKRHVGKRYGQESAAQSAINEALVTLARAGKQVVRLKGGDPLLFARGAEELSALHEAGIPFEIVPGVSSPVAASAYSGIPLTHRDLSSSVTFITGSDREGKEWSPESWLKLSTATDTICILMGMRRIEEIMLAIVAGGRNPATQAAVIQWAARPEQRVVTGTVATIAALARAENVANPAVIIVGDVVGLRARLCWFDRRPLFGKALLVPRPAEQGRATAAAIRARGASPVLLPAIEISEPDDAAPLDAALSTLRAFDWVLFTSANGVERFMRALTRSGLDARAFANAKIGVIGPKTAAALASFGLIADAVAGEFVGEGLARAVLAQGTPKRVLLARALSARDALPELLRAAGADVTVVPVYRTVASDAGAALKEQFERAEIDVALFTSSSTVNAVVEGLGPGARELLSRVTVASIGPITSHTLAERGIQVDVVASSYTVDGLLDALETHFARH
ncbi:MAG TPA: uroporphyrinogen-III C-methyltransferase [Polyangiaceae bacterium]|jgi:uroporphyrinogen III methyltransferase/synthase|nr:uroporphyrinogen-III C-methyltransferase [Polyangiaceae bacterium]